MIIDLDDKSFEDIDHFMFHKEIIINKSFSYLYLCRCRPRLSCGEFHQVGENFIWRGGEIESGKMQCQGR